MALKRILHSVLLFAAVCCALGTYAQQPARQSADTPPDPKVVVAVTEWLAASAIPLKTVEARNGFDDLRPLEKVLKNTRVVAL